MKFRRKTDTRILSAFVDGSFLINHAYSYGCVLLEGDMVIEELYGKDNDQEMMSMRNVAGEILGARTAVQYAIDHGYSSIHIYYDYKGIEEWATGGWKAKKQGTQEYRDFMLKAADKIHIEFHKVAAHTGVKYNECADKLAKYALGI